MVGVVVTASLAAHQQPEPATKPWTVAVIQKRLTQSGLQTRVDVKVEQPYLSVPGQVLVTPDGTEIQAYIYRTTSAREADTRKLDPKKAAPPTVQPHWLMPVSLVSNANTALIVLSRDPAMHGRIASLFGSSPSAQTEIEDIVRRFHQALQERDVKSIEVLVDEDLVVFENGERNDGWADFRDNHLVPELQEPAPQSTWELISKSLGRTGLGLHARNHEFCAWDTDGAMERVRARKARRGVEDRVARLEQGPRQIKAPGAFSRAFHVSAKRFPTRGDRSSGTSPPLRSSSTRA